MKWGDSLKERGSSLRVQPLERTKYGQLLFADVALSHQKLSNVNAEQEGSVIFSQFKPFYKVFC